MFYLDSSAALKLVISEAETRTLRDLMARETSWAISEIGRVEVLRGAGRRNATRGARELLSQATFIFVTTDILEHAASLDPPTLRSLDAIHVASALSIREHLDVVITYDTRMQEAAEQHGLTVHSLGR